MRIIFIVVLFPALAWSSDIFTRDGVTDGDGFYLPPGAILNNDPAYQSWVTYSLIKSTCQLKIGGNNPARASSFECEYKSRLQLVNAWEAKKQLNAHVADNYLDALSDVRHAGYLAEYTVHHFKRTNWIIPQGLRRNEFRVWANEHLKRHKPQTNIIGSWNYKSKVDAATR